MICKLAALLDEHRNNKRSKHDGKYEHYEEV